MELSQISFPFDWVCQSFEERTFSRISTNRCMIWLTRQMKLRNWFFRGSMAVPCFSSSLASNQGRKSSNSICRILIILKGAQQCEDNNKVHPRLNQYVSQGSDQIQTLMPLKLKNYITPDGERAIRNFYYKGGSSALSYDWIWSPLANWMLRFIPIKWAPNAITLAGFILVIIGTLVICMQGTLGDIVPESSCIIFAVCIATYQTLDNIDGKQARRTKTSSPLGMLFDHGCDAMSCFCLALSVSRMMMITNEKLLLFGLFLGVLLSFYMSVWAQYHSNGIMHLGKVNAVDDGIPLIWILGLITSVVGSAFWSKELAFGVSRGVGFLDFIFLCSVLQTLSLVFNTGSDFTKDLRGAFKHFLHIFYMTCSLAMVTQLTDWWKVDRYYNQLIISIGFMYVRNTTYMQLCVTTQQPYNQFTTANFVFCAGYPLYILVHFILGIHVIPEWLFVNGMMTFFIVNYVHFAISIVWHMSQILGIKPFSIRPQLLAQGIINEKGEQIKKVE